MLLGVEKEPPFPITPIDRSKIITMSNEEFNVDLNMFFRNLSYVAERTASFIIEELYTVSPIADVLLMNT